MVKWQDLKDYVEGYGRRNQPDNGPVIAAVVIGAGVGLAAGLLLAPDSGENTRARLRQRGSQGMDRGKDTIAEAKDRVVDTANDAKTRVSQSASHAAEEGERAVSDAKAPPRPRRSSNGYTGSRRS